ncbi:MAG: hypothetical protein P1V18_06265 [Candidatus Gracilibacteria bacterium]|nr:hypothetical protein [Candidatus Gracilibacteria bacterium]
MKKYISWSSAVVLGVLAWFFLGDVVTAQNTLLPFNPELYPGVDFDTVVSGSGSQGVVDTLRTVYVVVRRLLGPIMVFLIAVMGIQLVVSNGDEEALAKTSRHFTSLLMGIGIVVFADFLSQTFFLYRDFAGQDASFLSGNQEIDTTAALFKNQVQIVIVFLRYLLGGLAVFYLVKSGFTIITSSSDEETVTQQKEVFMYGFLGFLLIMISEALVNVFFDVNTLPGQAQVDVSGGLSLLGNLTNFFLALVGGLSLFTLVIGGAMYSFTAGNEERGQQATKLIYGSLIGLVMAFSSYTIVAEFARSNPVQIQGTQQTAQPLVPLDPLVPGP